MRGGRHYYTIDDIRRTVVRCEQCFVRPSRRLKNPDRCPDCGFLLCADCRDKCNCKAKEPKESS